MSAFLLLVCAGLAIALAATMGRLRVTRARAEDAERRADELAGQVRDGEAGGHPYREAGGPVFDIVYEQGTRFIVERGPFGRGYLATDVSDLSSPRAATGDTALEALASLVGRSELACSDCPRPWELPSELFTADALRSVLAPRGIGFRERNFEIELFVETEIIDSIQRRVAGGVTVRAGQVMGQVEERWSDRGAPL
jgi:hypothetical protein